MKFHSSRLDIDAIQSTDPDWYKGALKIIREIKPNAGFRYEEEILPIDKRAVVKAFNLNPNQSDVLKYLLRYEKKYPTRQGQIRDVLKMITYASFILEDLGKNIDGLKTAIDECEKRNEKEVSK